MSVPSGLWFLRSRRTPSSAGSTPEASQYLSRFPEALQATVDSRKFNDLLGVFGQMEETHPAMPHWYLPWFGVDCALQGQGLGSRLMTPCLDIVDREHLPAYLDSTIPRNVPFYQRHGFEVTGRRQAGDSPPITSMLREPR